MPHAHSVQLGPPVPALQGVSPKHGMGSMGWGAGRWQTGAHASQWHVLAAAGTRCNPLQDNIRPDRKPVLPALQLALDVAPVLLVLVPGGQRVQAGCGVLVLPPAEKVPRAHTAQVGPPLPGLQMVTASGKGSSGQQGAAHAMRESSCQRACGSAE